MRSRAVLVSTTRAYRAYRRRVYVNNIMQRRFIPNGTFSAIRLPRRKEKKEKKASVDRSIGYLS